jgi:hypothetical protein
MLTKIETKILQFTKIQGEFLEALQIKVDIFNLIICVNICYFMYLAKNV